MADTNLLSVISLLNKYGVWGMNKFDNRITLQKAVYMAQQVGVKGLDKYQFSWYLYGPYCPELTKEAFELKDKSIDCCASNGGDIKKLEDILRNEKIADPVWMEVIGSIHFLKRIYPEKTQEEIIGMVEKKQPYIKRQICLEAWTQLEKFKLIA
jgi:uncharacterized protein YwgA